MASRAVGEVERKFGLIRKKNRFSAGLGALLPEAYRKFWWEWKMKRPAAVHYIPEEGKWKRDPVTGEVSRIQNVPIILKWPNEFDNAILGGEALIQGFQKRSKNRRRVPHFWFPVLRRSVVYSEILNMHLSVVVTARTIKLINDHYGFDHYLLKTQACDLKSKLALKLKRKLLEALRDNCPAYEDNKKKQFEILDKYDGYMTAYTQEEIEWYGLDWEEAIKKMSQIQARENQIKPLKQIYRLKLIEKLRAAGIKEAIEDTTAKEATGSWLSKINPFAKKET